MKTATKTLIILLFASLFFSFSAEETNNKNSQSIDLETGGEDSSGIDDDRNPNGE